jgi:hypothetical protein
LTTTVPAAVPADAVLTTACAGKPADR